MDLHFEQGLADAYKGRTQRARILSEAWVHANMFCPRCGAGKLMRHANNRPAGDFRCYGCSEEFELKSKAGRFGAQIVDGAFNAMLLKIRTMKAPNLFLLGYDPKDWSVKSLDIVPRQFFSEACLQERRPLAAKARRAGWVGCNILLSEIPRAGVIPVISNQQVRDKPAILDDWFRVTFLKNESRAEARGWLLHTMKCIDRIGKPTFSLAELYAMEPYLRHYYPENHHIRPKIRQQLQVLRDAGYLYFLGKSQYRLTEARLINESG